MLNAEERNQMFTWYGRRAYWSSENLHNLILEGTKIPDEIMAFNSFVSNQEDYPLQIEEEYPLEAG